MLAIEKCPNRAAGLGLLRRDSDALKRLVKVLRYGKTSVWHEPILGWLC